VEHVPDDDDRDIGTVNRIEGGVIIGSVIQGRDIQVHLPSPAPVALAGLPPRLTRFTGRAIELAKLAEILAPRGDQSVVVVSALAGLAGVGKTALAIHAGHEALEAGWFDAVLFLDLFGYDPTRRIEPIQALGSLLRSLGVPGEHIPLTQADREALYRSLLVERGRAGQRVLIVADNVSATGQVVPLLAGDPHRVLVTSRSTLADLTGARLLEVDVLTPAEAIELLDRALSAANPADSRVRNDLQAVEQLSRLCGHLPLALQVVAALLRSDPKQPIAEIVQTLSGATNRLRELDYSGELGVRGAFDLSYQHLDPAQARLFRLLSLNPGTQTSAEAAAALADVDLAQIHRLLDRLRRAHLLQPGMTRGYYRFHDLLRLYAADSSAFEDDDVVRDAAIERLLAYYLITTRAAISYLDPQVIIPAHSDPFVDRQQALSWLDRERSTLVASVTLAQDTNQPTITADLSQALFRYFDLRKDWIDWLTTHQLALAATRRLGNRQAEGRTLNNLGIAHHQMGTFDEALACHQSAVDIAREIGDRCGEGHALNCIGIVQHRSRRFDEALSCYQQAVEIAREIDDHYAEGRALMNLGAVYYELRRFDESIAYQKQALTVYRNLKERRRECQSLTHLGLVHEELRRFDEALGYYQESLEIAREIDDHDSESRTLANLGNVYRDLGMLDEAIVYHQQALTIYRDLGNRYSEGHTLTNLGNVYQDLRRFDEAITHHEQALTIYRDLGNRYDEGQVLHNLGNVYQDLSHFDNAITCYQQALMIYRNLGEVYDEGYTLNGLGNAYQGLGQFDDAISCHQQAVKVARQVGNLHNEGHALYNLGRTYHEVGQLAEAENYWKLAVTAYDKAGSPDDVDRTRASLASLPNRTKSSPLTTMFYKFKGRRPSN
jgi:tetratricopeptide (TPR) repeat protein